MTLDELVSATAALGKAPPVSRDLTVEDVGAFLFQRYTQTLSWSQEEREDWFDNLVDQQKSMLLTWLVDKGFAPLHLASELGTTVTAVRAAWDTFATQLGSTVQNVKMDALVGTLCARAERLFQMAMQKEDYKSAWKIQTDQIKQLQDLGVVKRAVYRQEVVHEMGEGAKAELDRMLDLREKEKKNRELAAAAVDTTYETGFKSVTDDAEQEIDLATAVAQEEAKQATDG